MPLSTQSSHKLKDPLPEFGHVKRFWDSRMNIVAAKILPGECYVTVNNEMVVTVLGSCIAACIRDKALGVGGMNHFMLPVQQGEKGFERSDSINPALCYGNWAMEFLINEILKQGGKKNNLEVKIFGGGRVLSAMNNIDVGGGNIEFVYQFLQNEGLKIDSQDVGGDYPRKVLYFPKTGKVKMRRIVRDNNTELVKTEKAYIDSMQKKEPDSGDVELF